MVRLGLIIVDLMLLMLALKAKVEGGGAMRGLPLAMMLWVIRGIPSFGLSSRVIKGYGGPSGLFLLCDLTFLNPESSVA